MDEDDDMLQSEVKQPNRRWQDEEDGAAPPGCEEFPGKKDYELKMKSLNKQIEILYQEVQRLVQIVRVSKVGTQG